MSARILRSATQAEVPEKLSVQAPASSPKKQKAPSAAAVKAAAKIAEAAALALRTALEEAALIAAQEASEADVEEVAVAEVTKVAEVGEVAETSELIRTEIVLHQTPDAFLLEELIQTVGTHYREIGYTGRSIRQALVLHLLDRKPIRGTPDVSDLAKRLIRGSVTAGLLVAVTILYGVQKVIPEKDAHELFNLDLATLLAQFICGEQDPTESPFDQAAAHTAILRAGVCAQQFLADQLGCFDMSSAKSRLEIVFACVGIPAQVHKMDRVNIVKALTAKKVYLRSLILTAFVLRLPATGFKEPIAERLADLVLG